MMTQPDDDLTGRFVDTYHTIVVEKVPNILAHLDGATVDCHGSGIFKRAPCIRDCEVPASYVELVERDDLQQRPRLREFLRAFLQGKNADGTSSAKGLSVYVGHALRNGAYLSIRHLGRPLKDFQD